MRHSCLKLCAVALAFSAFSPAAFADNGGGALNLSSGSTFFGRNDATGSFTDTWTFTLASAATIVTGTASTSAAGPRDLDFSSVFISTAAVPGSSVTDGTFIGNLGDDINEFFQLRPITLAAGSYDVIVKGINSADRAAYSGTLTIATAVPEPETYALFLAGLGLLGLARRRKQ